MEHLPGMSERDTLEQMSPNGLIQYIMAQGEKVTRLETAMNLANEVLEGAYGTTFEEVLMERENGNTKT